MLRPDRWGLRGHRALKPVSLARVVVAVQDAEGLYSQVSVVAFASGLDVAHRERRMPHHPKHAAHDVGHMDAVELIYQGRPNSDLSQDHSTMGNQ